MSVTATLLMILTATSIAGDPIIGPQIPVDTVGGTSSANETTASAGAVNPLEIIAGWNDYREPFGPVQAGFSLSQDGGMTWDGFLLRPPLEHQTFVEGDPMTAVDPRTGTMWAGAIAFGNGGGLYIAKKDSGATEFEPAVMVDTTAWVDKGWMAVGPRRNQPDTTRVFCSYNFGIVWSDDMGATWTPPKVVGQGRAFLPRVGPDGEIFVLYTNIGDGVIRLGRSLDDGATFTTHDIAVRMDTWSTQENSRFPGVFRVPALAYLDVDPNTGTLHASYFDVSEVVGDRFNVDVFYTRSFDQGTTWETPRIVNGDSEATGDQFHPWLEVDAAGRVHMIYFDSRHTDQDEDVIDCMLDVYYAVSRDGGDTFREYRLTPESWNAADDGFGDETNQFIGDYLGIATAGDRVYPVYIDTSVGRCALYTNVIDFSCNADLDGSGAVDFADILRILGAWGNTGGPEDLDSSGNVDFGDLLLVLAAWGPCP